MTDTKILDAVLAAERGELLEEPYYAKGEVESDSNAIGRRYRGVIDYFQSKLGAPRRETVRKGTCENSQGAEPTCEIPQPSVYAIETRIPGAMRVDGLCMKLELDDEGLIGLVPGCGFEVHRAGWTNRKARDEQRAKDREKEKA